MTDLMHLGGWDNLDGEWKWTPGGGAAEGLTVETLLAVLKQAWMLPGGPKPLVAQEWLITREAIQAGSLEDLTRLEGQYKAEALVRLWNQLQAGYIREKKWTDVEGHRHSLVWVVARRATP